MNSAEPKGWNKEKIAKLTEDIQKILAELENIPGNNIIKFKVEVNSGAETILDQLKEINRDKKDDKLIELSNEIFATKNNIYSDRKLEVLSAKSNLKKPFAATTKAKTTTKPKSNKPKPKCVRQRLI